MATTDTGTTLATTQALRILIVEDTPSDAELMVLRLREEGFSFSWQRVQSQEDYLAALASQPDLVISDWRLPRFSGLQALHLLRARDGDTPFVIVSGSIGEETAIDALHEGASDYVLKDRLARLGPAVRRALEHCRAVDERQRSEAALRRSEAGLAKAQTLARLGSWQLDVATGRLTWSAEMYRLFGLGPASTPPQFDAFLMLVHPDDRPLAEAAYARLVEAGGTWSAELRSDPAVGPLHYFSAYASASRDVVGRVEWLEGTMQDITERRLAEEKLHLAARVFESTGEGITMTDAEARIVAVNPAFERITGYGEAEVLGRNPSLLQSGRHDAAFYRAMWASLRQTGQWRNEIWNRRKNGEVYPQWMTISAVRDAQGRTTGYVAVFSDISDIKEARQQLDFFAHHDPLTRLPNRALLNDRLAQAIEAAERSGGQVALLLLNVDRLQRVNDSLGHDAGDALLKELAQRLLASMTPGDTLARPGSDELVMVLTQFADAEDIMAIARRLLDEVARPCQIMSYEVTVTASIGISVFPGDGTTPSELLKAADTALSHVKDAERNGFRFFTPEMNTRVLRWVSLENHLRRAIERDELLLHYQPQVSLTSGHMCGAEALIRWRNPELGLISPADFIPLAEDTGLIVAIGEWVIRTACAQNKAWQDAGLRPLRVSVNVSALQISAGTLPDVVRSALAETGLDARYLEIELTESVMIRETEATLRQIGELNRMGVSVSLDDFGTGYSSLGYLSRFKLDKLKIDQGFIRNVTSDPKSAAIARATIALAQGLGITVTAEGVETVEQLTYLHDAGCDEMQGFLYSRPVPPEDLAALIVEDRTLSFAERHVERRHRVLAS